jgi:HAD superfamily hydrolase (TIGR01450 family)
VPTDLSQYEAVLLDLDGTIYHEEVALPGAVELIRRLQATNHKYACLTNSTSSPERVAARLQRMGVAVDPLHIYTAAAASADYVLERFGKGPEKPWVFNLSTEAVQEMLEGKVHWAESETDKCDAVICGVPVNVFATEDRRRTALVHLRKGAALIGICADRVYPSPRGIEFGVGAMASMLAYAADVTPIYCGKPETIFFHELCERLHVKPHQCVLIGDNLESDIAGAKAVGMRTILTLTGITTLQDATRAPDARKPDAVITDLSELLAGA